MKLFKLNISSFSNYWTDLQDLDKDVRASWSQILEQLSVEKEGNNL